MRQRSSQQQTVELDATKKIQYIPHHTEENPDISMDGGSPVEGFTVNGSIEHKTMQSDEDYIIADESINKVFTITEPVKS